MSSQRVSPYGSWRSPVTSDTVAAGVTRLGQIEIEGEDIYWSEMRPLEAGRYVIVKHAPSGETIDVNPPPFNARTRVHANDTVYFTDFTDQRIYTMTRGEKPWPITPKTALRYADFVFDTHRRRIICVREDHRQRGKEAVNTIISMDLHGENVEKIVSGNDFYSSPRISPDGNHLAWITWNHPHMPWDQTELWMGELREDHLVEQPIRIA
jgi:dipeptidyl aminopeptidase/acylaminoacyl peptidase